LIDFTESRLPGWAAGNRMVNTAPLRGR